MGIPVDVPREAVEYAWREASRCTANDVSAMHGFMSWGLPMRPLRDRLCPLGWIVDRKDLETVVSPDRSFQIASARGNSHTGDPSRMPSTLTERGKKTRLVVKETYQCSIYDSMPGDPRPADQPRIATWFLLHHFDPIEEVIRMEISRGMEFRTVRGESDQGVISHFEPRILLDPIDVSKGTDSQGQEAAPEDIDIPVTRREVG
jgi:hypothetical protein